MTSLSIYSEMWKFRMNFFDKIGFVQRTEDEKFDQKIFYICDIKTSKIHQNSNAY